MKVVTAGVAKAQVKSIVDQLKDAGDDILVTSDMDAAMKLRMNQADFYIGTCQTGAGASLGVIPGLVGADKCHTFGRKVPKHDDVVNLINEGIVAFGCCIDQVDDAIPVLWKAFKEAQK